MTAPMKSKMEDAIGRSPAVSRCKEIRFPHKSPLPDVCKKKTSIGAQSKQRSSNNNAEKGQTRRTESFRQIHVFDKESGHFGKLMTPEMRIRSETTESTWSQDTTHGAVLMVKSHNEDLARTHEEMQNQAELDVELDVQWMIESFSDNLIGYNQAYLSAKPKHSKEEHCY